MKEYRTGNAIVRIHGKPNMENIKEATGIFLKGVQNAKKKAKEKTA